MALDLTGMMQAVQDPTQAVLQGYQFGQGIKQQQAQTSLIEAQKAKIEAAKARQAEMSTAFNELLSPDRETPVTAEDYSNLMVRFPEMTEQLKQSHAVWSDGEKEQAKQDSITMITALETGNNDLVKRLLEERKTAYKNDPEKLATTDALIKMLEIPGSEKALKATAALQLNSLLGEKEFAGAWDKIQSRISAMKETPEGYEVIGQTEAGELGLTDGVYQKNTSTGKISKAGDTLKDDKTLFRMLTPEEISSKGLPAGNYQIDGKSRIYPIGQTTTSISVKVGEDGGYKVGSGVPAGYALKEVEGEPVLVALKGGPVATKTAEDKKKETMQAEQTGTSANVVKEDINRLTTLLERQKWYNPVTGIGGKVFENIPASARSDAEALKTTISANIGFDRLQQMRDASKTGGALGAISEREMTQLSSVLGSLDFSQSDDQILSNLKRLDDIYTGILKKAGAYPDANQFGFGQGKAVLVKSDTTSESSIEMPPELAQRYQ